MLHTNFIAGNINFDPHKIDASCGLIGVIHNHSMLSMFDAQTVKHLFTYDIEIPLTNVYVYNSNLVFLTTETEIVAFCLKTKQNTRFNLHGKIIKLEITFGKIFILLENTICGLEFNDHTVIENKITKRNAIKNNENDRYRNKSRFDPIRKIVGKRSDSSKGLFLKKLYNDDKKQSFEIFKDQIIKNRLDSTQIHPEKSKQQLTEHNIINENSKKQKKSRITDIGTQNYFIQYKSPDQYIVQSYLESFLQFEDLHFSEVSEILHSSSRIVDLCHDKQNIFYITDSDFLFVFTDSKVSREIPLNVTQSLFIFYIDEDQCAVVSKNGEILLIDYNEEKLLDFHHDLKFEITTAVFNGVLYLTGVDYRITTFQIKDQKISKYHKATISEESVLDLAPYQNTVFGLTKRLISRLYPTNERLLFVNSSFNHFTSLSGDFIALNNYNELLLFEIYNSNPSKTAGSIMNNFKSRNNVKKINPKPDNNNLRSELDCDLEEKKESKQGINPNEISAVDPLIGKDKNNSTLFPDQASKIIDCRLKSGSDDAKNETSTINSDQITPTTYTSIKEQPFFNNVSIDSCKIVNEKHEGPQTNKFINRNNIFVTKSSLRAKISSKDTIQAFNINQNAHKLVISTKIDSTYYQLVQNTKIQESPYTLKTDINSIHKESNKSFCHKNFDLVQQMVFEPCLSVHITNTGIWYIKMDCELIFYDFEAQKRKLFKKLECIDTFVACNDVLILPQSELLIKGQDLYSCDSFDRNCHIIKHFKQYLLINLENTHETYYKYNFYKLKPMASYSFSINLWYRIQHIFCFENKIIIVTNQKLFSIDLENSIIKRLDVDDLFLGFTKRKGGLFSCSVPRTHDNDLDVRDLQIRVRNRFKH